MCNSNEDSVSYKDITKNRDACYAITFETHCQIKILLDEYITEFWEEDPYALIAEIATHGRIGVPIHIIDLAKASKQIGEASASLDEAGGTIKRFREK